MAHNIDNRRHRERRHRRAYLKAVRRLNAFDRQAKPGARDQKERFRLWLKRWRARHPEDSRDEAALERIYASENAPAKRTSTGERTAPRKGESVAGQPNR